MKTSPYWWEDFPAFDSQTADFVSEADVVVVGAGLTGCSAALTLAKAGKNVVVLDAARPGFGASTRNGGMIGGGYRLSLDEMGEKYGKETAFRLLDESYNASHDFAVARIEEEKLDCDYVRYGRFRGMWNKAEYDMTSRQLDVLRTQLPNVDIDMVPPERQRDEIGSDLYSGGVMFNDHGGVHPGKYLNGMLMAVTEALANGDKVTLVGFGTFSAVKRAARKAKNPRTGEMIKIPAKTVAKFKPGSKLAEAVK